MKGIKARWSILLPMLSALLGGAVGYLGATITIQNQIESLQAEIAALGSVAKDLESAKQMSSTALSKANDAIKRSTSAYELAIKAANGVEEVKRVAKHVLEKVITAEAAMREAISKADTAVSKSNSASTTSDAAQEIANSALSEAKLSIASAAEAMQAAQRASDSWPGGGYCILKRGNTCPPGFKEGQLHFDTEDNRGDNRWRGLLPAGSYYKNNLDLKFCCK